MSYFSMLILYTIGLLTGWLACVALIVNPLRKANRDAYGDFARVPVFKPRMRVENNEKEMIFEEPRMSNNKYDIDAWVPGDRRH